MNRVYFHAPKENWIVDQFKEDWDADNVDITVQNPWDADVLWINADWCWRQLPMNLLHQRKVLVTVHHIVPEKFTDDVRFDFMDRDRIVDAYHVYNERTLEQVKSLSDKPVHLIRYWCNQNRYAKSSLTKSQLRDKHGLPLDAFITGSFQRDTEGASIETGHYVPKLEKGADKFCDALRRMKEWTPNLHVLLTAWRRQYVIGRLVDDKIPYSYFELPKQSDLVELYQCLDLYMVTSRHEGGPQALLETGALGVPVVSTPCGIAEQVLPTSAINIDVTKAIPAVPHVSSMLLPNAYIPYRQLIESL